MVFNNEAYVDEDEEKTREIDLFGVHIKEADDVALATLHPLFIATDLAVECKRTETHAWVFMTRPKVTAPGLGSGQVLDFDYVFTVGRRTFLSSDDLPKLHYDAHTTLAHAGVPLKIQKNKSDKDEIFEARQQLMKYAIDFMKERKSLMLNDNSRRDIIFLFLAIVLDGPLYEASVQDEKLNIRPQRHIVLRSGRYSRTGEYFSYLIDIVREDFFPEFLSILEKDVVALRSFFHDNHKDLVKRANDLWPLKAS